MEDILPLTLEPGRPIRHHALPLRHPDYQSISSAINHLYCPYLSRIDSSSPICRICIPGILPLLSSLPFPGKKRTHRQYKEG